MNAADLNLGLLEVLKISKSTTPAERGDLFARAAALDWSAPELAGALEYAAAEGVNTLLDPVLAGVPVSDVIA